MKFLLLEDDLVDQMAFQRWASRNLKNSELIIANNIEECKVLLNNNHFDFLICDYLLPDGSVMDIVEIADPKSIICISGIDDPKRLQTLKESGISKFFFKDNQLQYLDEFKKYILGESSQSIPQPIAATFSNGAKGVLLHLDHLKRAFDNKPDPIKDVIHVFLKQTPGDLKALKEAVATKDLSLCHNIAHRLKSSFQMMGLFSQMEKLKELEQICSTVITNGQYCLKLVDDVQKDAVHAFQLLDKELQTL